MDKPRLDLVNIAALLLGSGLTVFAINTVYVDFIKQPFVDADIYWTHIDGLSGTESNLFPTVGVYNKGLVTASNITLVITSVGDISYYNDSLFYEQDTNRVNINRDGPNKLIVNIPSLVEGGNGASIKIVLPSSILRNESFLYGFGFGPEDIEILAAYNNRGYVKSFFFTSDGTVHTTASSYTYLLFLLVSILGMFIFAVIFFFIPQLYKAVKNVAKRTFRSRIYSQIVDELQTVITTLNNDINSKRIFPQVVTDYEEINPETKHIFDNYDDLRRIKDFYTGIRMRDSDLSSNQINIVPSLHNRKCLRNALYALNSIDWTNYGIHVKISRRRSVFTMILGLIPFPLGIGHLALHRIRRGLLILILPAAAFVIIAQLSAFFGYTVFNLPQTMINEFGVQLFLIVYSAIYLWQLFDLRNVIRKIKRIELVRQLDFEID